MLISTLFNFLKKFSLLGYFQMMSFVLFNTINKHNLNLVFPIIYVISILILDFELVVIAFLRDQYQNIFFTCYYAITSIVATVLIIRLRKHSRNSFVQAHMIQGGNKNETLGLKRRRSVKKEHKTLKELRDNEKMSSLRSKWEFEMMILYMLYMPLVRNTVMTIICDDRDLSSVNGVDEGGAEQSSCRAFSNIYSFIWFFISLFNFFFICLQLPYLVLKIIRNQAPKINPFDVRSRLKYHLTICSRKCKGGGACLKKLKTSQRPAVNTKRVLRGEF